MSEATQTTVEQKPAAQLEGTVRCRSCGHEVTRQRLAIEVQGAHEHTFRNPAGYSFHVLCFSDAPGCLKAGTPTSQDTWFRGYAWSYALCGQCQGHLGWWFSSTGDSFAGLIATRLLRAGGTRTEVG
ncbi:MAG: cereblon family protein [Candidatus Eremiobacterota bacterium]